MTKGRNYLMELAKVAFDARMAIGDPLSDGHAQRLMAWQLADVALEKAIKEYNEAMRG